MKRTASLVLLLAVSMLAACSSPTAPAAKTCVKGRTDCSPYIVAHDTLAHP